MMNKETMKDLEQLTIYEINGLRNYMIMIMVTTCFNKALTNRNIYFHLVNQVDSRISQEKSLAKAC